MYRFGSWRSLAIVAGLVAVVALIALLAGKEDLASVLVVVGLIEGAVHALLLGIAGAKRRSTLFQLRKAS
jgi:hypothetical protein